MTDVDTSPDLHYGVSEFHEDSYIQKRLQTVARLFDPYLEAGLKVLDVGGYTADLQRYLPKDVNYFLMDFDKKALEEAQKRGVKVKQVNFDEETITWHGEKFDVIVCTEVLEHVKDPHRHMEEMASLLKEDGKIIISLPNENTLYHRIMSLLGFGIDFMAFDLYKHLHFPTIKQSEDLFTKYFRLLSKEYYIVMSGKSSKVEKLSFINILPDGFWLKLAYLQPSLFARGTIFLGERYE